MEYYMYVCYPIRNIKFHKDNIKAIIDMGDEMESFSDEDKAISFMKDNYGKYMLSLEKCDEDLWKEIKKDGN